MSKKASSTLIGLFTLIGLIIAGSAIVMLGAGKYFEKSHKVLLYFDKSVNGLQVGSDVRFGGVRIGRVSSISVIIDTEANRKIIPVILELTDKELTNIAGGGEGSLDFSSKKGVELAVKQGLRAGMKQQSLVTGQLYVEFDIVSSEKGFVYDSKGDEPYPVIPTIATEMDEMIAGISDGLKKINELDLGGLIGEMRDVLENLNTKISDVNLTEINENLIAITRDVREITGDDKLATSLKNLDSTLVEIRELSGKANKNIDPILEEIKTLTETTRESLKKMEATAEQLSKVTDTSTRQLRELTNDLKRNPSSLLRGKDSQ